MLKKIILLKEYYAFMYFNANIKEKGKSNCSE